MRHQSLVILAMASAASGLDIAVDYIQCDTSLPAYAEPNGLTMACDGSSRCTMGQNATLSGKREFVHSVCVVCGAVEVASFLDSDKPLSLRHLLFS